MSELKRTKEEVSSFSIRNSVVKDLIRIKRTENWVDKDEIGKQISNRDIINFSLRARLAEVLYALDKFLSENIVKNINIYKLETDLEKIIVNSDLIEKHKTLLKYILLEVVDEIIDFDRKIKNAPVSEIRSLLGKRFDGIDINSYGLSKSKYLGILVVKFYENFDQEDYYELIRKNDNSIAFYNRNLGNDFIKGHVLVLSKKAKKENIYHEYQHFLQYLCMEKFKNYFNNVTKKQAHEKILEANKVDSIKNKELIKKIWQSFQKEAMAYSITEDGIPIDIAQLFPKVMDQIKNSKEYKIFLKNFKKLCYFINRSIDIGIDINEISFIISLSDSIIEATKFLFLRINKHVAIDYN